MLIQSRFKGTLGANPRTKFLSTLWGYFRNKISLWFDIPNEKSHHVLVRQSVRSLVYGSITDRSCRSFLIGLITVRNKVAKVMFLHLSVILFTGGVCLSACWDTTPPRARHPPRTRHPPGPGTPQDQATPPRPAPPGTRHPPPADGYCCGRYASYWNAFLLKQ